MKSMPIALVTAAWAALLPFAATAQFGYVSNEKDGTLSIIDTAKDEVVGSIKAGKTLNQIKQSWETELTDFKRRRQKYLLY